MFFQKSNIMIIFRGNRDAPRGWDFALKSLRKTFLARQTILSM